MNDVQPVRIRNRTTAQIAAARPEASVWVSANAGTGKTGVLVDRISRLLLEGVAPERILCLTFTKAAAAEMANRLTDLLSGWSAMTDDDLRRELHALGEKDADADKIGRARRLFAETLEAPEGLRIRTIHSFCESLLGRFPIEAGITPDFRVMDERAQRELQGEARDRVFSQALAEGSALTEALRAMAALVDEDGLAGLMREIDGKRSRFRAALHRFGGADGLSAAVADALGVDAGTREEDIIRAACGLSAEKQAHYRRVADAWAKGAATNQAGAATLSAFLDAAIEVRIGAWRDVTGLFLTQKEEPRSEKSILSKGALSADEGALPVALEIADELVGVMQRLRAVRTLAATRALITVAAELTDSYEDVKARHGRLDYDDLIDRASLLLDSPSGVSWVHYKLDGGIDHILVDEAQDTSPSQWQVIEEVGSDFFSGESRHEEVSDAPRTVFAVGDEKQSIYSFQGADPEMFGSMEKVFKNRVEAVERPWVRVEMAESFRSAQAVLDVVDKVFDVPEHAEGLRFGAGKILHRSARRGQSGRIELWPKEEPRDDDEADVPWDAPVDHVASDSPAGRVAMRIATKIRDMLRSGEVLPAQGRPCRPGDFLILVQKRNRLAEMIVATLKTMNIDVAGRDRMVLATQLAIQDLIALGRLTLLPEDDLTTACVLKGPLVGLSEDDLFRLAHGRKGTLLAALRARRDEAPYAAAWAKITDWRNRADFMPPFEFFSAVLDGDGGRRALLARLGPEAAEPIEDFLGAAIDFERDHVPSLEGFLHWLETGEAEVKRDLEQGRNEVRVMTVHGAKGLQAEVVFLADACSVPASQNEDRIGWADATLPVWPAHGGNATTLSEDLKAAARAATLAEYRRLFYVAMTRAKDRLYIAGHTSKRMPKDVLTWHDMATVALSEIGAPTDDDGGFIYETPQTAEPDGGSVKDRAAVEDVALPAWAITTAPGEPTPPAPLSPSRPDDAEPPVRTPLDTDDGARFLRGRIVHALMQTLPELPEDKRAEAAAAYAARPVFGLSADAQAAILGEVMAILNDPAIQALFGPDSRAEVPIAGTIATKDGPRVVSGQIDRLAVTDGSVLIVDYKTNRPPPATAQETAPVYLRQMATYRAALQPVFPGMPIRCVLLWTDGPNWMELPDTLLQSYAP